MAIGYDFIDLHKSKITLNIPNMKISILKNFHGTRILYLDLSNVTLQKDSSFGLDDNSQLYLRLTIGIDYLNRRTQAMEPLLEKWTMLLI